MLRLLSHLAGRLGDDFDADFYRAYYDDLAHVKAPRAHYLRHGVAEGRFKNLAEAMSILERQSGPLPEDFSPAGYRALNPDLDSLIPEDWRLTLHYLQFGRAEGRRYHRDGRRAVTGLGARDYHYAYDLTKPDGVVPSRRPVNDKDFALETPFVYPAQAPAAVSSIAAIVHCYYPEIVPALLSRLANIPLSVDLFLSTDTAEKKREIQSHAAAWDKGSVEIRLAPNRGRDIAPMLIAFRDVFDRYELFLHVHTKKSPHGGDPLGGWRDYLVDALFGDADIARSVLSLFNDPRLGVVFPQHYFLLRGVMNWGYDYDLARGLLRRLGVAISKNLTLEFPSGSMFVARTAAIRPLVDLGLSYDDFPEESGQIDGTLAHAIERSLLMIAEASGYEWLKVVRRADYPLAETVLPVREPQDVWRHRLKVFQPTLARVDGTRGPADLSPAETRPLLSYPSRNERPRLTLLVPTINASQSFGGIATALKLFDAVATALGDDFDRRIVVTDAHIEAEALARFDAYRSEPYAPTQDEARRQLVDAFERDGGRLNLRAGDVFLATAWWTAGFAKDLEAERRRAFGGALPFIYLIQDDEPFFYGWSTKAALAEDTYLDGARTLAVINSEELFAEMTRKYDFREAWCLPYALNDRLSALLAPAPRERQILVYGRPSVARNAYELICDGLFRWQQSDPVRASRWSVLFLGEDFPARYLEPLRNATIGGKATLEDYAARLNRASIGVSLMMSPHPSYPPLEMAEAGLMTIANRYGRKDLRARFPGIVSLDRLNAESLAAAIEEAVDRAEPLIGTLGKRAQGTAPKLPTRDRLDVARLAAIVAGDVSARGRVEAPDASAMGFKRLFGRLLR